MNFFQTVTCGQSRIVGDTPGEWPAKTNGFGSFSSRYVAQFCEESTMQLVNSREKSATFPHCREEPIGAMAVWP